MSDKYSFDQFQDEMSNKNKEKFLQKKQKVIYPNVEYVSENIPTEIDNFKIKLCVFYIEDQCVLPFVKYAVKIDKGVVCFQDFPFVNNFDSEEHLENMFIKTCDDQLRNVFTNEQSGGQGQSGGQDNEQSGGKLTGKIRSSFENCYRGFIPKNDIIFVFYDITTLLNDDKKLNSNFKYAITDEIYNVKSIFSNSIDESISKLFAPEKSFPQSAILNPWMEKSNGSFKPFSIPRVGYLCTTDNDGDSFYSLTQEQIDKMFIVEDCLINPKNVGFYYFFSTEILKPKKDAFYIRYAFFTINMLDSSDARFPNKSSYKYEDDVNSVLFKINATTKIYGLKSPSQFVAY
jgi:hypothetical protein